MPCGRDQVFVLFAVILARKIHTKRVRNTVEKLCLHNRSHYIVYSRPPVVLITLPESRFWNARWFFAHSRVSCRGIMEVGMGRTLPINKLHSTRQVICQILKVYNEETAGRSQGSAGWVLWEIFLRSDPTQPRQIHRAFKPTTIFKVSVVWIYDWHCDKLWLSKWENVAALTFLSVAASRVAG